MSTIARAWLAGMLVPQSKSWYVLKLSVIVRTIP